MSPEAQRIAIAEACGVDTESFRFWWKSYNKETWAESPHYPSEKRAEEARAGESHWSDVKPVESVQSGANVPDYLNSLDAVHEAEKVLTDEQRSKAAWILVNVIRRPGIWTVEEYETLGVWEFSEHSIADALAATAPQRCEALLRVLGKWEEGR